MGGDGPISTVQIPDEPERNRKVIAALEASGYIVASDGRERDDGVD